MLPALVEHLVNLRAPHVGIHQQHTLAGLRQALHDWNFKEWGPPQS